MRKYLIYAIHGSYLALDRWVEEGGNPYPGHRSFCAETNSLVEIDAIIRRLRQEKCYPWCRVVDLAAGCLVREESFDYVGY